MAEELGLSDDQQAQMAKLREEIEADPNRDRSEMREAMQSILTPEQQAKQQEMRAEREQQRAQRMAQRDQEARTVMSDAEYETYLKKREEAQARRAARGGGRGGRRGGPGGGGGER